MRFRQPLPAQSLPLEGKVLNEVKRMRWKRCLRSHFPLPTPKAPLSHSRAGLAPGCALYTRLRAGVCFRGGCPAGAGGDWEPLLCSRFPFPVSKSSAPHSRGGGRYFFAAKKVSKKPPLIPEQRTHGLRGL